MIHPTAIIDPKAELDSSVSVGPYSVISAGVQIDQDTEIGPHVVIKGPATIGKNNQIFQFASLGEVPQDKKYAGEDTRLEIGDNNHIREYCTMNQGTVQGGGVTRLGNNNWMMAYTHVAHDCQVGNNTIFANGASIAGHVVVGDYANLGALSGVHQFCVVGGHCFIAAGSIVYKDVPPFMMVAGNTAVARGLNREGLRRRGFSEVATNSLKQAYKIIYRQNLTVRQAVEQLKTMRDECEEIQMLLDFFEVSERGIVR